MGGGGRNFITTWFQFFHSRDQADCTAKEICTTKLLGTTLLSHQDHEQQNLGTSDL